jgi:hypothetical protein
MLYFIFNISNSTHVYCKGCVDICPPPNDAGTCAEMCGTGCMNGQMCCSNGCGHSCMDPKKGKSDSLLTK